MSGGVQMSDYESGYDVLPLQKICRAHAILFRDENIVEDIEMGSFREPYAIFWTLLALPIIITLGSLHNQDRETSIAVNDGGAL